MNEPIQIQPFGVNESDAASMIGIGATTLRNLRKAGRLPAGLWVRPSPNRLVYRVDYLRRWFDLGCPATWPAGEPKIIAA